MQHHFRRAIYVPRSSPFLHLGYGNRRTLIHARERRGTDEPHFTPTPSRTFRSSSARISVSSAYAAPAPSRQGGATLQSSKSACRCHFGVPPTSWRLGVRIEDSGAALAMQSRVAAVGRRILRNLLRAPANAWHINASSGCMGCHYNDAQIIAPISGIKRAYVS